MLHELTTCQGQVSQRLNQSVFVGVTQQKGSERVRDRVLPSMTRRPSAQTLIFHTPEDGQSTVTDFD